MVRVIPLHGLILIRISVTLSHMSDSLFTAPTHRMHVSYDDGLKLIINDDNYIDVDLLYSYGCLLKCSRFRLQIFIQV
jgi:hypothetical protein